TLGGASPLVEVAVGGRPGRMVGLATAGPERYVVAVGLFTDTLEATLGDLRWLLGGVWIGSMVVTALVGLSLASRALRPVRMITERAAAIAEGQFETRLAPLGADDEIGRMTGLLNRMLERLHGALDANRRFAADASHELRSPLTVMLGEVDVALKRERDGDEYRRVLGEVQSRLRGMGRLTEDLMLLVRAQENVAPPITDLPLLAVWREVMARAADAAASAGVVLSVDVPAAMVVYAEAGLLGRVFDNLVQNAVQYNRDGGAVSVTARVEPGDGTWAADTVVIQVRDTGPGIPAAERERVFERFYRLDASRSRRTGGAGLGLAISREIVRLFKGSIRIVATDLPGTTVEVRLPGSGTRVEAVSATDGAAARSPA
ncbi:MAG: HAMP domain-containing histidine kinase, partial [Acidobacteria bacterium]|nr:HAMP domain-containing histidine kinase [Acidobacteriota bacterium]